MIGTTAAIVGCGDVSVVHFEAIAALGIGLVAVVDTDPAGLERAGWTVSTRSVSNFGAPSPCGPQA